MREEMETERRARSEQQLLEIGITVRGYEHAQKVRQLVFSNVGPILYMVGIAEDQWILQIHRDYDQKTRENVASFARGVVATLQSIR